MDTSVSSLGISSSLVVVPPLTLDSSEESSSAISFSRGGGAAKLAVDAFGLAFWGHSEGVAELLLILRLLAGCPVWGIAAYAAAVGASTLSGGAGDVGKIEGVGTGGDTTTFGVSPWCFLLGTGSSVSCACR